MTDLDRLEELAPDLADWWRARRREAWREVGLVRPFESLEEAIEHTAKTVGQSVESIRESFQKLTDSARVTAAAFRRACDGNQ